MAKYYLLQYNKLEYSLYSDIILKAHYHISDKCTIKIMPIDEENIVEVILLSDELSEEELKKQFQYYLSQEKIKSMLYEENHRIKELIVEHAFKPIHIKQVL